MFGTSAAARWRWPHRRTLSNYTNNTTIAGKTFSDHPYGTPGHKGITIDLRLSHQAIAEAIGSTRVTITRLLGDLKTSGLVNIDRKKITVLDPIALAKRFN